MIKVPDIHAKRFNLLSGASLGLHRQKSRAGRRSGGAERRAETRTEASRRQSCCSYTIIHQPQTIPSLSQASPASKLFARTSLLSAMASSSSSSTGTQINQKIDSTLPPAISDKLPHVPETKEQLKKDLKQAETKSLQGLRSLAAGGFGGVCAVVVGHPFDLVKVRLQTAERGVYNGALDVVRKGIARDGLRRGLYAGVSAPLVGVTPMCKDSFLGRR